MVAQTNWLANSNPATETPSHEVQAIGPDLTLHTPWLPGQERAYVIDWRGNTAKSRPAENEDFLSATAITGLSWQMSLVEFGEGALFAAAGRGWEVRRVLRSDGRWRVVAMRMAGQELEVSEFEPDHIDIEGWLKHLS